MGCDGALFSCRVDQDVRSVACSAVRRRRFIEQNRVTVDLLLEGVASRTGDILVAAPEREYGLLVVEERGLPLLAGVARGAISAARAELIGVRVLMTLVAYRGSVCELNVQHILLHVRRFVAIGAGYGAMGAFQWKLGARVVELRQLRPLHGCVAGLAPHGLSLGIQFRHAHIKFASVYVCMAGGTSQLLEMVKSHFGTGERLVALIAYHRLVATGQRPTGLLVLGQRVAGGLEGGARVALLAAVGPRCAGKLAFVLVFVAIHAEGKLHLEDRLLAGWDMAFGAFHHSVRKHQREFGLCMIGRREGGRTPTIHRVAALALAAVGALGKLPAVRIGRMTVGALRMTDRCLEVFTLVAGDAVDLQVLAQ